MKERDEPRPRAGILRTREFIMKDSYSFDRDQAGLDEAYEKHRGAYARIYDRCGLEWFECQSDVGMMGGTVAHEYMAPCAAGEDDVAIAEGYSANVEVASADPKPVELPAPLDAPEALHTPGLKTVDQVAGHVGVPAGALLKAFPVLGQDDGRLVMVVVRGDHRVNEIKLRNTLRQGFRPATEDEIAQRIGPAGFIGPVGAQVDVLLDRRGRDDDGASYVAGANELDQHLRGVRPGRDFPFERADVRTVEAGDTVDGKADPDRAGHRDRKHLPSSARATPSRSSATYLDRPAKEQLIVMGSYGIGPARIAAAAVEQFADDRGISWPKAIAPWDVELVVLGKTDTPERAAGEQLYEDLRREGVEVLFDDRDAGPGEKFADAELVGCPLRLTLGRRSLESGTLEAQTRRGRVDHDGGVPLAGAAEKVRNLWANLP